MHIHGHALVALQQALGLFERAGIAQPQCDRLEDLAAEHGHELLVLAPHLRVERRAPGVGPAPQHQQVPVRPGAHQGRAEAVRERQHADEHGDHERDAERREGGRHGTLQHTADVVDERDLHSTCRSACTTGRRAARSAGTSPLASIKSSAITPPSASVAPLTSKPGRNPAPVKLVARYSSFAPPRPRTAPASVITPASSITSPNSRPSEKPIVLRTATSPVRSRALIIIALAVTSRIANTTAMPIVFISRLTLPHMVAKLALNACSVPVLVAALEFLN